MHIIKALISRFRKAEAPALRRFRIMELSGKCTTITYRQIHLSHDRSADTVHALNRGNPGQRWAAVPVEH